MNVEKVDGMLIKAMDVDKTSGFMEVSEFVLCRTDDEVIDKLNRDNLSAVMAIGMSMGSELTKDKYINIGIGTGVIGTLGVIGISKVIYDKFKKG